jgi:peroxiredoxin
MSSLVEEYNRPGYSPEEARRNLDPSSLDFQPALHVGMAAPEFVVADLEGNPVRLSDFRGKKHVVFEFGCITAPVFINDITSLNRLSAQFQNDDVQFLIIYVREAHAGESYRPHTSFEQKLSHARDLQRLENVQFPVLVDSLAGDTHRAYGVRPSPVYVINKDGLIVYKASWLIPEELELALGHLLQWERWRADGVRPLRNNVYSELWTGLWINPAVHERVFARTGGNARAEVRHAFGFDPVNPNT